MSAERAEGVGVIEIWGLRTCDACRRAVREARAAGGAAELRDVREDGMPAALRARAAAAFGEALVNRRSTTWRGLDDEARELGPEALIAAHPAVMKRPLVVAGDALHLGWGEDVRGAVLGA